VRNEWVSTGWFIVGARVDRKDGSVGTQFETVIVSRAVATAKKKCGGVYDTLILSTVLLAHERTLHGLL
jgi:hypothetical protein